jgi:outer membrane protein assembly factor BamB
MRLVGTRSVLNGLLPALALLAAAGGADLRGAESAPRTGGNAPARIGDLPQDIEIPADAGGFCVDLGCGDGKLATEIARKTKLYVFALAKDDADCRRTRLALEKAGLYGTRATAMTGSLRKLPLPRGYGNLIVTGEYQDTLDLEEVLRVLNPNGMAVIGGGKAGAAKLKTALDAAGIRDYQIFANYATFRGRMPSGVTDWTHMTPRPDNITTSHATAVRPPFRLQWLLGEPCHDAIAMSHGAIARGRFIYRLGGQKPEPDRYYAWDAFNGALLWDRPVETRDGHRYALVDGVYYAMEGKSIVALDAATGEKKTEYRFPDADDVHWWWLAVENGKLYALAKIPPAPMRTHCGLADHLCAFDLKSGRMSWKHESKDPVIFSSAAVAEGGVYFCTVESPKGGRATSGRGTVYRLDAGTGRVRWHTDAGRLEKPAHTYLGADSYSTAGYYCGKYFAWNCLDPAGKKRGTRAFDARTGGLVKEYYGLFCFAAMMVQPPLFVKKKVYCSQGSTYKCWDLVTGEESKSDLKRGKLKCGPGCATQSCLFSGGQGLSVFDLETGKLWRQTFFRSACGGGPYVANGMILSPPVHCGCPYSIEAPAAMAPAGPDWTPPAADKDMASRLVRGPAFGTPLSEAEQGGWTHYRGNPGHTGETAAPPKTPLALRWERRLGGRLTPPSLGGGLAYVASREGRLWGLDQSTGEVRWTFLCGAGVRVTPAYGQGRVLFGSDDGWVYCLEAGTGKLAWRFRAAPGEYYINVEGQINSCWPSTAGVILDGDTVYCTAGLISCDGTYLYALDLKTGKVAWANRIGSESSTSRSSRPESVSLQGIMTLSGDVLIVTAYKSAGTRGFRKADGQSLKWYMHSNRWTVGSETVADGGRIFFCGGPGRGKFNPRPNGSTTFSVMDIETGGQYGKIGSPRRDIRMNTCYHQITPSHVAPVLGRQVIVGDGAGYDRARFREMLEKEPGRIKESRTWSVSLWPKQAQKTSCLALAGGVVVAGGTSEVAAFEAKVNGRELGRARVPGTILRNSLAVAEGRVLVVTEEGGVYCLGGK